MRTVFRRAGILLTFAFAIAGRGADTDWFQFIGPARTGLPAVDSTLAPAWAEAGPHVVWEQAVGAGFAGVCVWEDSVLLLDREAKARDVLRRLRLTDGSEVWRSAYDAPGELSYDGSRTTPATNGETVCTIGPFGDVKAFRFADGTPMWEAHLLEDWGAKRPGWGVAQSPLVFANMVIVAPWGKAAAVVAYEIATGKVLWSTPNPTGVGQDYSSPVIMELDGRPIIVASGLKGYTIGLDPRDGRQLWAYADYSCRIHIVSPTILDGKRVFLTGGYKAGCAMFQVQGDLEAGYTTRTLWKNKKLGSQIAQPLFYKEHLYGNSNDTNGGLTCLNPSDGSIVWQTGKSPGFDIGSLIILDGRIYAMNGGNGDLVMATAHAGGYAELGRARILSGNQIWGCLAVADGKLLLRDQQKLVCVDLRSAP